MEKIQEVICIGDGGAFDTNKINSSFVIKMETQTILYDCGYNVFPELKNNYPQVLEDITTVIISHMDDDHVGSLKSLLYYKYFVLGQTTLVTGDGGTKEYLSYINQKYEGSTYIPAAIIRYKEIDQYIIDNHLTFFIKKVIGVHHIPTFGVVLQGENGVIGISGDTKANPKFEIALQQSAQDDDRPRLIFHDYSYWDAPSRNVHTCQSDFIIEYSEKFQNSAIKYHNTSAQIAGKRWVVDTDNKWHTSSV